MFRAKLAYRVVNLPMARKSNVAAAVPFRPMKHTKQCTNMYAMYDPLVL